jgi:imidazolonepropionase-like amidohydrolase
MGPPADVRRRTILAGGTVFDGSGADPRVADVAIEAGRIVAVGQALDGGHRIDVTGLTLLPGLIDCHAHVAWPSGERSIDDELALDGVYAAFEAVGPLRATLDAGVTTVRDAAGATAGHRRAIDDGLVAGPRLVVSLSQLSPSAGPNDARSPSGLDAWISRPGIPPPVADGPDALRHKVREYVQAGADVIKIFATGNLSMARRGAHRSLFTEAELEAIVDEAGRHGLRVMAHAHGADGAVAAARAGVASIEHGFFLDDEAIAAMAAARVVFVPTLLASHSLLEVTDDEGRAEREAIVEGHLAAVRAAHAAGVPIAMGTDCGVAAHGRNPEELELLVKCGLTPAEALAAATSTAAALLGLEDEIGRIAVGLRADLIVIKGDSLDVRGLGHRVRDVYQAGVRVGPGAEAGRAQPKRVGRA